MNSDLSLPFFQHHSISDRSIQTLVAMQYAAMLKICKITTLLKKKAMKNLGFTEEKILSIIAISFQMSARQTLPYYNTTSSLV